MNARIPAVLIAASLSLLSLTASADEPKMETDQHFKIDPVGDGVLTAAGAGAAGLTDLILSTGEIKPQPVDKGAVNDLLSFDRTAATQTIDPTASTYSNIGLYAAVGFAVLDPVLSGLRDGWDAALVDAVMYAESLSLTLFVTDVTKIAVRRPRPTAYLNPGDTSTNSELSFFSGHASTTAAVAATATYLAFVRAPNTPRPWITLAAGTLLTAFVSYERVRSGAHFPTDVIAGSMAGAAIGVLVPHLHRAQSEWPHLWIGAAPAERGGGVVTLQGRF